MTPAQLQIQLDALIAGWESECVEFKAASHDYDTSEIGRYFSALSNEANLRELASAWLIFGVENKSRKVVGTAYRPESDRLQSLKQQIAQGTEPSTSFREIHELATPQGRIILFEIPPAPRGIPIAWQTHFYARNGSSLSGLTLAKQDQIRAQSPAEDWSAVICRGAGLKDLDPDALTKAREVFVGKYRDRIPEETIRGWSTSTFLDKAKLTIAGKVTRACILLLGRSESTHFFNPCVAELTWKLEGPELAYEHFHPPFFLATSLLYQRIRNIRLTLLPPGQLIPIELPKYDQRIVLEALHNCVAHQDYSLCERVLVIERPTELVFRNAGSFFDGEPQDYFRGHRTPTCYRNKFLAEAMVSLRMIDTMGFGIREVMFKGQARRYLPLPDYDLSEAGHVAVHLQGRFIDENYSRALFTHADLPWPQVLALDAIQKGQTPDDDTVQVLRQEGLVEGRRPALHVAPEVAAVTGDEAGYIAHKGFEDDYYCDLIVKYLRTFGTGTRTKFRQTLSKKFSDLLTAKQKDAKVRRLLQRLRREGRIQLEGERRAGVWRLPAGSSNPNPAQRSPRVQMSSKKSKKDQTAREA